MPGRTPGRIELDPRLPPVCVSVRFLGEMAAHARETWPEECCGLVIGAAGERFGEVFRCHNDMTALHFQDPRQHPNDGRRAFHMNEHDYLEVARQARQRGREVTAVYHSHVDAGVYFSEVDQEYARAPLFPFPDADHIVLSLVDGRLAAGLFQRAETGFVGRALVAAAS